MLYYTHTGPWWFYSSRLILPWNWVHCSDQRVGETWISKTVSSIWWERSRCYISLWRLQRIIQCFHGRMLSLGINKQYHVAISPFHGSGTYIPITKIWHFSAVPPSRYISESVGIIYHFHQSKLCHQAMFFTYSKNIPGVGNLFGLKLRFRTKVVLVMFAISCWAHVPPSWQRQSVLRGIDHFKMLMIVHCIINRHSEHTISSEVLWLWFLLGLSLARLLRTVIG